MAVSKEEWTRVSTEPVRAFLRVLLNENFESCIRDFHSVHSRASSGMGIVESKEYE